VSYLSPDMACDKQQKNIVTTQIQPHRVWHAVVSDFELFASFTAISNKDSSLICSSSNNSCKSPITMSPSTKRAKFNVSWNPRFGTYFSWILTTFGHSFLQHLFNVDTLISFKDKFTNSRLSLLEHFFQRIEPVVICLEGVNYTLIHWLQK